MPDMGIEGYGEVISIGNSPEIASGPGCVVTGRFRHVSDDVLSVRLSDQSAALDVAAQHSVYSLDRGDFVAAGELLAGERCFSIINHPISSGDRLSRGHCRAQGEELCSPMTGSRDQ